jgi:signal transduction histidine kinase/AraC-like DNA-binding protein
MKIKSLKSFSFLIGISIVFVGPFSCDQKKEKKFKIGFSQCVSNDAWRKTMHEEMFRELSFYPEFSLEIKDAEGDNQKQISQIREFQKEKVDLLIVSPNESEPITAIVEEIYQSGIPVIVIDRKITSNLYSAYIGGDNFDIGYTAGQYIINLLNGEGNILEIWGLRGSSPAKERHRGLVSALKGTRIEITSEIEGEWEKETARDRLSRYLSRSENHDFDLVFGHNDMMTIAAFEVCKDLNIQNKKFIGVDALPGPYGGIQAITDGVLDATFFYPTGGEKAIEIARKILSGNDFDKENILHTAALDDSNIRIMKQQTDRIINQQNNIFRQKDMIDNQLEIYQSQRGLLIVFGLTLFVAIISLAYVFKSLKDKQEINRELQLKNNEILEQQEKVMTYSRKAEEATKYKLDFFTNISHEFRTPLTLIQGPIEELIHHRDASNFKNDLMMIRKNTLRLLRLVNQLMDFRKIDSEKMQVRATEQILIPFLKEIMSVFQKTAKENQIHFKLISDNPNIRLWFDPIMMDKVVFNLLSNAFKFCPKRGFVHINVMEDSLKHEVILCFEDSGQGMDKEDLNHAFERFYQGNPGTRKIGTGLGLALSKELINLQHGSIQVYNISGEKTVFEIRLKMGTSHFDEQELDTSESSQQEFEHDIFIPEQDETSLIENIDKEKNYSILIIEDDPDIRNYLSKKFKEFYNVMEAEDIRSGLSIAYDTLPDLITCDLMLKDGDGLELIEKLKKNSQTSAIPIIVISAKTSDEDRFEGIKYGVDDYITKPFNISFVLERIKTILANRTHLREHYLHELPSALKTTNPPITDKKFTNSFLTLIEENIDNPNFGVNEICTEMGLSRGQLYRKTKSILGYSVNDYINKVRLKKAKHLLVHDSDSIADISSKVGYNTSAYFSTVFKSTFGITPSEFRESQLKDKK